MSSMAAATVLGRSLKVKHFQSIQSDRFLLAQVQVLDLDDLVLHFVATNDDCELGAEFLCSLGLYTL